MTGTGTATAQCPVDHPYAVSGGGKVDAGSVQESYPSDSSHWVVTSSDNAATVTAYVICVG